MASTSDPLSSSRRKSMTPPPHMCEELRIVLLGKNSSEISRVGNFILGREAFDTEVPPSVEQHSERARGMVEGRYFTLINTPHLFDPQLTAEELDQKVRECVSLCDPGPHVIVLVLKPDDFTEADRERARTILTSLSEEAPKHTLVLTTQKLMLGSSVDKDEENSSQMVITEYGDRFIEFSSDCSRSAVVQMMEMIGQEGGEHLKYEEFEDAAHTKVDPLCEQTVKENEPNLQKEELKHKEKFSEKVYRHFMSVFGRASNISDDDSQHQHGGEATRGAGGDPEPERIEDSKQRLNVVLFGREAESKNSVSKLLLGTSATEFQSGQEKYSQEFNSMCVKRNENVSGCLITLVGMPALYNTQISEEEAMRMTLNCFSFCDPGIDVFLLVVNEKHLTDSDKGEIEKFKGIFSSQVNKHTIVLINQQSQDRPLGEDVERMIKDFGERYVFIPTKRDGHELFNHIKDLHKENHGTQYTMLMYANAQVQTQLKLKRELKNLQDKNQGVPETTGTLRIVLLGKTGVGKSATGNTILGKENVFHEDLSDESVTTFCQKEMVEVEGRQIIVIDTPGLFDTHVDNTEVTKEITKCIFMAAPGPHVFLLVLKIGQRFTKEEKETVKMINDTFGERSKMYIIVLFTRGDELKGESIEHYVKKSSKDLKRTLLDYGNRYHVINNNNKSSYNQVTTLLQKIDSMVAANGGSCYTNEMFQQVEKTLQEEQERILKEKEEEIKQEKEELIKKYESEMENMRKDMLEQKERQETEMKRREEEFKEKEQQIKTETTERERIQREDFKTRRDEDEKKMKEWMIQINREREESRKQLERQREEDQRKRVQEEEERRKKEEEFIEKQREEKEKFEKEREDIKKNVGEELVKEKKKTEEQQKIWQEKEKELILQQIRKQKQHEWEKQKEMKERDLKEKERQHKEEEEKKRIENEANEKIRQMKEQLEKQREKEEKERKERDEKQRKEMEEQLQSQRDTFRKEREEEEKKQKEKEQRDMAYIKENQAREMKKLEIETEERARKQAEQEFCAKLEEEVKKAREEGVKKGHEEIEAQRTRPGRAVDELINKVCGPKKTKNA